MNPNPNPNYILPREMVDYRQSFEIVEEIASIYCANALKQPQNSHLEIEIKLGYAVKAANPFLDNFLPLLQSVSERDFVLMGLKSSYGNLNNYFPGLDYLTPNFQVVKERLSKKRYLEIKNYLNHQVQEVPDKIKEGEKSFSIDFQMQDGSRVSYYPMEEKWSSLRKNDKSNIDILHKGNVYRMSLAFEEKLEFDQKTFSMQDVKSMRIKDRRNFNFQYMEYSFTETVDLNDNEHEDDRRMYYYQLKELLKSEDKTQAILDVFVQSKLKMLDENEIEVEIKDVRPFIDTRGRPEFGSYLKRFIRNVEALVLVPKYYASMVSKEYFGSDIRLNPTIGQYSSELFIEKYKKSKQKPKENREKKEKKKDKDRIENEDGNGAKAEDQKPAKDKSKEEKVGNGLSIEKKKSEDLSLERNKSTGAGIDDLFID